MVCMVADDGDDDDEMVLAAIFAFPTALLPFAKSVKRMVDFQSTFGLGCGTRAMGLALNLMRMYVHCTKLIYGRMGRAVG